MSLIIDRDYQKYLAEAEDKATKLKVLRKEVIKNCKDLKSVYTANTEDQALENLNEFHNIWGSKYPHIK